MNVLRRSCRLVKPLFACAVRRVRLNVCSSLKPVARRLTLHSAVAVTGMSGLVIKTSDIDSLKEFYTLLGLQFVQEKHGAGPLHYSTMINGMGMRTI
jgi:hypothetical protein